MSEKPTESTELVQVAAAPLARAESWELSREQKQLIKDTYCRGATDEEMALAIQTCNRLQLDPFAKQIHFVKRYDSELRREVMSAQVSIEGFRLVATRTGKYRGQTEPLWCGPDRKWVDVWLSDDLPPAAAKCGVRVEGWPEPLYSVARFESYAARKRDGQLTKFWRQMPDVMIHKCAEALALRKAFPQELSGVYTTDEMGQANVEAPPPPPAAAPPPPQLPAVDPEKSKQAFELGLEEVGKADNVKSLIAMFRTLEGKLTAEHLEELRAVCAKQKKKLEAEAQKSEADEFDRAMREPGDDG